MKITFFNYLPLEYGGGFSTYLITVAQNLKKMHKNLTIDIVAFDQNIVGKINLIYSLYYGKRINKHIYMKTEYIKRMLHSVYYCNIHSFSSLRSLLLQSDIVYSKNDILEACILRYIFYKRISPKIIFGFHTPICFTKLTSIQACIHNILYNSIIYRYAINNAHAFHVLNKFDENLLHQKFPNKRIVRILNPVVAYKPITSNVKSKLNENKVNVLWIGRLTEQKGIRDFISIIHTINTTAGYSKKVIWHIAGDGELRQMVQNVAKEWQNVKFYGYLSRKSLLRIYSRSDILASTSKWESLPYNILEAQSVGLPVIAYNIPGCNECIDNGNNGYLVDTKGEFIDKIIDVINHDCYFLQHDRIKKDFVKQFDNDSIYKKLFSLLTYD